MNTSPLFACGPSDICSLDGTRKSSVASLHSPDDSSEPVRNQGNFQMGSEAFHLQHRNCDPSSPMPPIMAPIMSSSAFLARCWDAEWQRFASITRQEKERQREREREREREGEGERSARAQRHQRSRQNMSEPITSTASADASTSAYASCTRSLRTEGTRQTLFLLLHPSLRLFA